ncbi:MAG: hypothetical protein H6726_20460 [Sandaracinaceae bacterium]|nr:hypothetical protein [Sandaracinaceae bacterium]
MKCPSCQRTHKRRDGLTCACGAAFVFDPKDKYNFTDTRFAKVLRRVSAGYTRSFTKGQLRTAFVLEYQQRALGSLGGAVLFAVFMAGIIGVLGVGVFHTWWGFALGPVLTPPMLVAHRRSARRVIPSRHEVESWITRWTQNRGPIKGLLREPSLSAPTPYRDAKDLFDYGVAHLLVVDSDLLVDFLVLNGWAAQHHCLVVSHTGYPTHAVPLAHRFLGEQPDLPVWLYHGPTRHAFEVELREAGWPLDGHPVRDLGLFAAQLSETRFIARHFPGLDLRTFTADMLPPPVLLGALGACLAAGATFGPLLAANRASNKAGDSDSDFG